MRGVRPVRWRHTSAGLKVSPSRIGSRGGGRAARLAALAAILCLAVCAGLTAEASAELGPLGPPIVVPADGTRVSTGVALRPGATYRVVVSGVITTSGPWPGSPTPREQDLDALYCFAYRGPGLGTSDTCTTTTPPGPAYTSPLVFDIANRAGLGGTLDQLAGCCAHSPLATDPAHRYEATFVAPADGDLGARVRPFGSSSNLGVSGGFSVQLFGESATAPPATPGPPQTPAQPQPPTPGLPGPGGGIGNGDATLSVTLFGRPYPLGGPAPGGTLTVESPKLFAERVVDVLLKSKDQADTFTLALVAGVRKDTIRAYCFDRFLGVLDYQRNFFLDRGGDIPTGAAAAALVFRICLEDLNRAVKAVTSDAIAHGRGAAAQAVGCRLSPRELTTRPLSGKRLRARLTKPNARSPRPRAHVTCLRLPDGTLRIRVASSPDTALRKIVGPRLRIGLARPASAPPAGQRSIRFERLS